MSEVYMFPGAWLIGAIEPEGSIAFYLGEAAGRPWCFSTRGAARTKIRRLRAENGALKHIRRIEPVRVQGDNKIRR